MAFVEMKECPVCEEVENHVNGKCSKCESRKYREKVHKWDLMTYDD